jgi:3-keto-5-aminohexanoate cleavage enzyme
MEKVVLTVATTGAWTTKDQTPYVPLQLEEIADEVYACYEAGASIAHIHVRDEDGNPSMQRKKLSDCFDE